MSGCQKRGIFRDCVSSKFTSAGIAYCGLGATIGFTWAVISIYESAKALVPTAVPSKSRFNF